MEQENQTKNRVSRIEEFLLDPEKTLFELLEEFGGSVEEIKNALSQIDVANLETLKGEDGKTPERGVDYFTDEDLDNIEAFILDRIPVVGEDVPSAKQVNEYIDKQIAKIPRVKGDKGNPGTPGKPGKDGSPDSALDIIKKLRSLDKNQGLQLNDVRGLSKKIALLNEVSEEFTQLKEDLNKIKIFSSGAGSDGAGAVASVNGKTGVVVLTQDDIGDGDDYVRTENNFTDALLSKLTGLPTSHAFTGLTDTPANYTGQAGKFVKVNTNADGLEFASVGGGGDMLASVYDPTSVNGDAFDMDNMVEGTNNKLVSAAEKTAWNAKLDDITGESIADLSDVDAIAGITDGKVLKWNTNKFVVADDNDTTYTASDFDIKDLTDSTGLRTDWNAKEDASNKVTSFQATPDNTHYASEKLVKDSLDAKASLTGTETLTNKRITKRVTAITSSATPTINTDSYDAVTITALAEAITSFTTNLSGTPTNFQKLIIRIKDNGTARAISWGDSFEAKGVALPTTTVISKVLTVGFIYDTVTSKWGCVAVAQQE